MDQPARSRREFLRQCAGVATAVGLSDDLGYAASLHCTPAPKFPVPLTAGVWYSQPFPVGTHDYHLSLWVDRHVPVEELDCDLGPPRDIRSCLDSPLLDVAWKIWDGATEVRAYRFVPSRASAWGADVTECMLGTFEGIRNAMFTLEWNVKKDGGRLKGLNPRVEIVKSPGYWCWL